MAVKPWNYPTYRSPGKSGSDFGYDGDPYYTAVNAAADFVDNGKFTIIGAIGFPLGSCISGQSQNTSMTASSWPPIWSLGVKGRTDASLCLRNGVWSGGPQSRAISVFVYDGTSYVVSFDVSVEACIAAGIRAEGGMLEFAITADGATGKRQIYINGIQMKSDTVTPWGTSAPFKMHDTNACRMAYNAYANWNTDTWSAGGTNSERIDGPMLIHHDFIDLDDPAVRANIWDDEGNFLWAGQDGSEWLGGTTPWYYSEVGVPYNGNRGSAASLSFSRVTNATYAHWGHPCGVKEDWPSYQTTPWFDAAAAIPGVKGVWDMSGIYNEKEYFLYNPFLTNGHVRRYSTSYGAYGSWPMRDHPDCIGAPGFNYSISSYHGYVDPGSVLDALCNGANKIWMTMALDFTMMPTANFGFQKVIGWRAASSSSVFGCYSVYPNGSGRNITLQYKPGGVTYYLNVGGIPVNTKQFVFTWYFDNGILKRYVNGVLTGTWDHSSSGTSLQAANGQFGWLDYTSSPSGAFKVACDFVAIGTGATVSDAEHIAVHNALMNGAY